MKISAFNGRTKVAAFVVAVMAGAMPFQLAAQINPLIQPTSGPLSKQTVSRLSLTDVARQGDRIVAVGDRGYILITDNNGDSWSRAKAPLNLPLLNAVHFSDAKTVWAVGHDSVVLKSTDQGNEWVRTYTKENDQRPLMDILFTDAQTGFAVGAYGAYYQTVNAGKTWTERRIIPEVAAPKPTGKRGRGDKNAAADIDEVPMRSLDSDRHLNAIIKLGPNKLFIAGEAGMMLKSDDNGKNWTRVATPYKGSFFGAVSADDGAVIIYGLRGNIFRAKDASLQAWTQVEVPTKSSMMGSTKLADGTIVLAGLSGAVLLSTDNGKKFTLVDSDTIKPLGSPVQGAANSLLVVGESGVRKVALAPNKK